MRTPLIAYGVQVLLVSLVAALLLPSAAGRSTVMAALFGWVTQAGLLVGAGLVVAGLVLRVLGLPAARPYAGRDDYAEQ